MSGVNRDKNGGDNPLKKPSVMGRNRCRKCRCFTVIPSIEYDHLWCRNCGHISRKARKPKTDVELLSEANNLAREFAKMSGWRVKDDFKFYEHDDLRSRTYWNLVVKAYDHIEKTDLENAVEEVANG